MRAVRQIEQHLQYEIFGPARGFEITGSFTVRTLRVVVEFLPRGRMPSGPEAIRSAQIFFRLRWRSRGHYDWALSFLEDDKTHGLQHGLS